MSEAEQKIELGRLHCNEVWLIKKIREDFQFSEITIVCQDGVPLRIKKVQYNLAPNKK